MKTLALLTLTLGCSLFLSACATDERPVPPHQSGDGGRGLNPGARAEASNGANVQRNTGTRY